MKITVTGSLGHISKPLTEELVQKGHTVTVISHSPERKNEIEALGAIAAIGAVEDARFLTAAFTGADAVYTMMPPGGYFDPNTDLTARVRNMADNYVNAIRTSGVKRVVHLSSIGAHMEKDSGLILLHREMELALDKLTDVAITFMRPVGFYYNLYSYVNMIKQTGVIVANYGADDMLIWVSPIDIAAAVAEELEQKHPESRKIRYVASDELTGNESASIIGAAIGKPDLKWVIIPGEQMQSGMEAIGMNPAIAAGLVEMYAAVHKGIFYDDYYRNRPALGKVKLKDFAKEFAEVYHKS